MGVNMVMSLVDAIVVIPVRLESSRFPNKPLAKIGDKMMIEHVIERAKATKIPNILLASPNQQLLEIANKYQIKAILTDKDLPTGTDRVHQALETYDPHHHYRFVVNLQGDLPTVDCSLLTQSVMELDANPQYDIITFGAPIIDNAELSSVNIVKVICDQLDNKSLKLYPAVNFLRYIDDTMCYKHTIYHHIGIYTYTRKALEQFIKLPMSQNEKLLSLEQMRAIDHKMSVGMQVVDFIPQSVDVPDDIALALKQLTSLISAK